MQPVPGAWIAMSPTRRRNPKTRTGLMGPRKPRRAERAAGSALRGPSTTYRTDDHGCGPTRAGSSRLGDL